MQHGGPRVVEHFVPRACVPANKAEATWPSVTFSQKLYSVTSAILKKLRYS